TKLTETTLFDAFQDYLQSIHSDIVKLLREFTEGRSLFYYDYREYSLISDSGIKPSGALFYTHTQNKTIDSVHVILEAKVSPNADNVNEVLGRIGEYAQTVWKAQFTRKFVPVLIHGRHLTLYIFSRKFPDSIILGPVFYPSDQPDEVEAGRIARVLQNIWFLLLQPSDKFGHIVDVSKDKVTCLSFGGTRKNATVALATSEMPRMVKIVDYTCQQVDVYRRVGYICNIKFEGKKAVLKLSWTPVSRIPEGAVYDVLRLNGVEGIPEIYSSGIICADFLGNRLEYIIMEYCGDSLTTYFDGKCRPNELLQNELPQNERRKKLEDCSRCVSLPRSGKFRRISDDVRSYINDTWGIDVNSLAPIEKENDPVTDTMCFMSIRMLAAAATRSLWDDIESLFYVVLGCLFSSYKSGFKSDGAPGFEHSSNKKSALAKAGGVGASDYAWVFGAEDASEELLGVANKLHTILFYRDGRCIAHNLLKKDRDLRDGEDR
ncbi:hypothetical protein GGH99_006490, partial [Coemansia sp. RSA 1285]